MSLSGLPGEARERVRKDVRATLQFHRDLARGTVATKSAKFIVSRGGVTPGAPSAEGFTAEVEDPAGPETVHLPWAKPGEVRCTCPTMKRLGTCAHALAVLETLFAELHRRASAVEPDPEPTKGSGETAYLSRLESLGARLTRDRRRALRASQSQSDPWARAAHRGEEVRYVLRFAERGEAASFRLEAQARLRGDERAGAWRSVPMAVEATSEDEALVLFGPEHAAVAAIASGAPDAEKLVSSALHRAVGLAYVDRVLAPTLLSAAARAGSLLVRPAAGGDPRPLDLELEGFARLEVVAVENARDGAWTLTGRVALPSGALVALHGVLAVSTDGVIAVAHSPTRATLAMLDAPGARHVIEELRSAPLVVPHEDESVLAAIAGVATLADDRLRQAAHPIRPFPCLRVDAPLHAEGRAAARGVTMRCTLEFDYGGTRVPFDSVDEVVPSLDGRVVARDRAMEDAAIARFFDLGGERTASDVRAEHDASVSGARFEGMVGVLLDEGWQVVAEDQLLKAATSVSISVASGVDWFELAGGVTFGDEEIPFPEILRAAQSRRGYVTLGDGSRGMLPDRWLERWRVAALGDETGDGTVRFDHERAWALAGVLDGADEDPTAKLEADADFRALRANLEHLTSPGPRDAPESFQGTLRPYQREGLGWLMMLDEVGLSGCLADDMGLGKTVQLLAYLAHRRENGPGGRSLVVAPRSLVFNWLAEARRFVPGLTAIDFSGSNRWRRLESAPEDALLVTTYGSLRRDAQRFADTTFDVVVLDEAQAIKSGDSQTSRAAKSIRARRRVSLTGTPIENHLGDLWSQLEFLNPGMLGASSALERLGSTRSAEDLLDEGRDLLSRALRPILLRRTKESVLHDLPPKTEQVLRAPLTGAQRAAYDGLADHYRKELSLSKREKRRAEDEGEERPELNVLAALTRLRQAACHPGLIDKTLIPERSGKLDLVVPMLESLVRAGSKALVFSSFTGLLGLVRTRLETLRVPYLLLDGATKDRGALVERFQTSEEAQVFLISIKAGGAGLNLTAADYVFLLDPWWNPAVEAQAIDRAHRIGRTRPVHVYRVLTEETVEAKVVELQERKRALAGDVLSGAAKSASGIGRSDLGFLLGV